MEIDLLEAQIRECYGRVVYTHKVHEKCADILNSRNHKFKCVQIILSVLTTSGILTFSFLKDVGWIGFLSAFLSTILTAFNLYLKNYDLGKIAQKHSDAASSTWNIRESYLSLLTDLRSNQVEPKDARKIRDRLQADLLKVYQGSPRTFDKAYQKASKALKEMEEMTFSDEEIDKFLPKNLRKTIS